VSNGLGFASYETGLSCYRILNGGVSPTPAERGAIAGVSATVVMAAIQPLEVIMRRMQVPPPFGGRRMASNLDQDCFELCNSLACLFRGGYMGCLFARSSLMLEWCTKAVLRGLSSCDAGPGA
jgi:hypothetical protein